MDDKVRLDDPSGRGLSGWAFVASDAETGQQSPVIVSASGTVLAQQQRTVDRPDVDRHVNDSYGLKGFVLPINGVVALVDMLGERAGVPRWLSISCGEAVRSIVDVPLALRDTAGARSLRLIEPGGPVLIEDAWQGTSNEIFLRLAGIGKNAAPVTVRAYEVLVGEGFPLVLASETMIEGSQPALLSVKLRNPLLPLLIAVVDVDDQLLDTDFLPFPSLLRGGVHHGEAAAQAGADLAAIAGYSDALLNDLIGWGPETPPFGLSDLEFDLHGATGAEPVFQHDMAQWLSELFGMGIRPAEGSGASEADGLLPSLTGDREPGSTLRLPANAVPTIRGLVARRPALTGSADGIAVPYVVAEAGTARPLWLVSLPPVGGWLDPSSFGSAGPDFPRLIDVPGAPDVAEAVPFPLAIRYDEALPGRAEQLVFPIAAQPSPPADGENDATISVIVPIRENSRRFEFFIESLSEQTAAARLEVIVVDNNVIRTQVKFFEDALERFFPGAHRYEHAERLFNHSALINFGASEATGELLFIANSSLILHDRRLLDHLARLARLPQVATASCMLLNQLPKASDPMFRSAGYFLDRYEFLGGGMLFAEPDLACFPAGLWPVAANSLDALMMRADFWREAGGLDPARFPTTGNDIDFAFRSAVDGRVHLCTTAYSAICERRRTRGRQTRVPMPKVLDPEMLSALGARAAVLRRL